MSQCQCVWKGNKRVQVCPRCPLLVIIESPLAGDYQGNQAYARACLLDSLKRREAPLASHLLYPQVLDDLNPGERTTGIEAGLAWGRVADLTAVYTDRGISAGMNLGIERAKQEGRRVVFRQLYAQNPPHFQEKDGD